MQQSDYDMFAGTLSCYPPEYFINLRYNGAALDRWCCALVLYLLLEGSIAFCNREEILQKPLQINRPHSPECVNFLQMMLHKDPAKRLKAAEVLNHPWFST